MSARPHIPLKTKLAAALLQMKRPDENGQLVRVISHEEAKGMTADQIISRFHFDHCPIPHAEGGPDQAWNLDPVPVAEHREKTAEIDVPQIAKSKRIRAACAEHNATMEGKGNVPSSKRRWRWPQGRKIPSRPMHEKRQ